MRTKKKHEFSDNEVLMARLFCVAVGGLLVFVGVSMAGSGLSVPPEVAWTFAAVGLVIMLFGLFAPRQRCVRTASFILGLVF